MKTITKTLIVLICILNANVLIAETPNKKGIVEAKAELINKIRRAVSTIHFVDCMKCGDHEQVVLRCIVNDNEEVIVDKILGCNEKLKQTILKKMNKSKFKISSVLRGQKIALHFTFEKHLKS
jgi:hypothetical protein